MSIQFNFKNKRQALRISQQNLALKLGISQSFLNQLETNTYKKSPRIDLIESISKELGGGCFLDIVICNGFCIDCRHSNKYLNEYNEEELHFYI